MRFDALKIPDHLVKAFIRLRYALPQLPMRLVVAGDGDLFNEVEERVAAGGVVDEVYLLGWKMDIGAVLRDLEVLVVSSLSEAGSYNILEAMAAALPVISTRVVGTGETVARVPGNILVPVRDPDALADGMRLMAWRPSLSLQPYADCLGGSVKPTMSTFLRIFGRARPYGSHWKFIERCAD